MVSVSSDSFRDSGLLTQREAGRDCPVCRVPFESRATSPYGSRRAAGHVVDCCCSMPSRFIDVVLDPVISKFEKTKIPTLTNNLYATIIAENDHGIHTVLALLPIRGASTDPDRDLRSPLPVSSPAHHGRAAADSPARPPPCDSKSSVQEDDSLDIVQSLRYVRTCCHDTTCQYVPSSCTPAAMFSYMRSCIREPALQDNI